ncbi:MAG: PEP-CTERM sorting domain-containing protein [Armatimonadetes bacterium]|nr:PEP-CTERM sorting domain-containing protein [Armatimonadota bacterium]
MKKSLFLAAALAVTASSQAALVYDTVSTSAGFTFYSGPGNAHVMDNFLFPTNDPQLVDGFAIVLFADSADNFSDVTVDFAFHNEVTGVNPTDPILGNPPVASFSVNFGTFTSTGAGNGALFSVTGLNFVMPSTTSSLAVEATVSSTSDLGGNMTFGYADTITAVGSSNNGFGVDLNEDTTITVDEFVSFASPTSGQWNLAMQIDASPVPEPATMLGLGALGAGILARRRRKS